MRAAREGGRGLGSLVIQKNAPRRDVCTAVVVTNGVGWQLRETSLVVGRVVVEGEEGESGGSP